MDPQFERLAHAGPLCKSGAEVSRHVSTRPSFSFDPLLVSALCSRHGGTLLRREGVDVQRKLGPRPEPDEVRTERLLKEITNNTPGLACWLHCVYTIIIMCFFVSNLVLSAAGFQVESSERRQTGGRGI